MSDNTRKAIRDEFFKAMWRGQIQGPNEKDAEAYTDYCLSLIEGKHWEPDMGRYERTVGPIDSSSDPTTPESEGHDELSEILSYEDKVEMEREIRRWNVQEVAKARAEERIKVADLMKKGIEAAELERKEKPDGKPQTEEK